MIIKMDMKNSFHHVKLSYLYQVLLSFGFSVEFVSLIKACTDKPWIAPLFNGRPTYFIQDTRGLHQGCPLSPFLYILMAKFLSMKLSTKMVAGTIPGIRQLEVWILSIMPFSPMTLFFSKGLILSLLGLLMEFSKISVKVQEF